MDIEEAVCDYLSRHPTVRDVAGPATAAGGSVVSYPMTIPQNAPMPCYAYQVVSQSEWMDHDGKSKLFSARIQFTCQARGYKDSKQLARAIAKVLRGKRGVMGDLFVEGGQILNEFDGYGTVGDVYITRLDVGIMYRYYGNVPGAPVADVVYNWYVADNGNDSNDGKSAEFAFATFAKLLTVLHAGETVGVSGMFRDEYSPTVNNTKIYKYGATAILDCRDVIANADFSKTAGQTNVYQVAKTVEYDAAHPIWNSMWENSTRLTRAASLAACEATPGSMYPSTDASANVTLYVHPAGSGNPITNGKTYEFAARRCGVQAYNVTGTYVYGLTCRANLDEGGSFKMGINSTLVHCRAEEGNKHNIYVRAGSSCYNTTASKAYYNPLSPSKAYFIYNEDTPAGEDIYFEECDVDNGGTYDTNAQGFFGHYNVSGIFGTVTCKDCTCSDMGSCFDLQHATAAMISNPTMRNCRQISSVPSNTTITGGSYLNAVASATPIVFGSGAGKTLTINGGFSFGTAFTAQNSLIFATSAQTIILNNVDLTAAPGAIQIWLNVAGSTLTINGCDFSYGTWVIYAPNGVTLTSDYNNFADASSNFQIGATAYPTVAAYQAGTGQDGHSTVG